jgi:superfamily II DNA or RNA helicase
MCTGSELGDLRQSEDEEGRPWERSRMSHSLSRTDFPERVRITKADMLYIRKEGFSQKALNAMKRLAAFKNPEFYRAQAMRFPTFDKPRVISLSDEISGYLCLPRGCEIDLVDLFKVCRVKFELADETCDGREIDVEFNGKLRGEQENSVEALLNFNNGVLSATTAFGKTVIGANLISARKVNTLVLVHTRQLLEQWQERLLQFLVINESLPADDTGKRGRKKKRSVIGQIGAGKNSLSGIVDIAVMQSLVRGDEVKELVRNYGMVIVDECHHVPAFSFERILRHVTAKYVYGLTATPVRQDGHHPIIFMQCGPVRYRVDSRKQAEMRPFEHFVIPRFTPFRMPVSWDEKEWSIGEIYSEICKSEIRNQLIINDVVKCFGEGRNPLILTQRTAHVKVLADALRKTLPNVVTLTGSMSGKERKAAMEVLATTPKESSVVVVATGKFVGEGFDEPRLDTLFLAMPVAWKGIVQQYAGRLHRLYENKSEVQIYDYVDVHVGILEKMYHKRLRGYASIGYAAKNDSRPFESINAIFDNNNFLIIFHNDVLSAKNEIIIVSPYISKRRLSQMLNIMVAVINNGIRVSVVTRPESDYKEKDRPSVKEMAESVRNAGINLIFRGNIHQKFAIIDQRVVWYGSINLLSFGSSEESIMRLESLNIANELTGTIQSSVQLV